MIYDNRTGSESGDNNICKLLDWDTAFFGIKVARLAFPRITEKDLKKALDWCKVHNIKCLYFLGDCKHAESTRLIEKYGFNFVDVRMTFGRQINKVIAIPDKKSSPDLLIRSSQTGDIASLKKIAKNIHYTTRFYYDPYFPKEQVDNLYMTWIEKSCNGYANMVLVLTKKGEPAGYITCHISDPSTGRVGLMGLSYLLQGVGAGQRLVSSALEWFSKQGVKYVEVVSQARNIKAQCLYQKCGFSTKAVQLWYHKWFK